jgi:hypothetical protein
VADLTEWLLAQISQDSAHAFFAQQDEQLLGPLRPEGVSEDDHRVTFAPNWSPARVLLECDAKRQLVELHRLGGSYTPGDDPAAGFNYCATCGSGEPYEYPTEWPCPTLRLLALPYAGRPGFRPEWQPDRG